MENDSFFFGRQIFREALARKIPITEIFTFNREAQIFAEESLRRAGTRDASKIKWSSKIPSSLKNATHQGLVFRAQHSFYISQDEWSPKKYPRVLLVNHIEDTNNLGAIARSSAAFGPFLVVHEKNRSAEVSAGVVKSSAGLAFHVRFMKIGSLLSLVTDLEKSAYEIVGLDHNSDSLSLYEWEPQERLAILVGSEHSGISKSLRHLVTTWVKIPMAANVESLNAAQTASIAMSWSYGRTQKLSQAKIFAIN